MEKFVVLKDIHFGNIQKALHIGDSIEHDEKKRQITINGEGPFKDDDIRAVRNLEKKFGAKYLDVDNSVNRKKARVEEEKEIKRREKFADNSVYEAEKFEVTSDDGQVVQELDDAINEDNMGHKYPRDAKKNPKDPGKPKAYKIGKEGSFRDDIAYKEGIETDFPIVEDNSNVAEIGKIEDAIDTKKPAPAKESSSRPAPRRPGRPKKN